MAGAPDGGAIDGTLIAGGQRYVVMTKKLLTIGDEIRGLRIVDITLDLVRLAGGARAYNLDLDTME